MENEIMKKEPATPGFGVAGMVMCPFFKGVCMKQGCELWVELKCGENFVGRCTMSWLSILNVEVRQAITNLKISDITLKPEEIKKE